MKRLQRIAGGITVGMLSVLLTSTSGLAGAAEGIPDPLVLSACDRAADWDGGTLVGEVAGEAGPAIRWAHGDSASVALKAVDPDWSRHNLLRIRIHSEVATGSRFIVYIGSENADTEGADYYSAFITLNFTGWKDFAFDFPSMGVARTPLGFDHITAFRLSADGWDNTPDPKAVVQIARVELGYAPPVEGPRLSEAEFFAMMTPGYPGLERVQAAVAADDMAAARSEYVSYLRTRTSPKWHIAPAAVPGTPEGPDGYDTSAADRIVARELVSCGIPHQFGDDIDWSINPTKLKYAEWTWQLSRHPFWVTLGRAYRATGDEKYAREFDFQISDWIRDNPVPVNESGNTVGSRWRTIECGIRMASPWPNSLYYFLGSPSLSDETVVLIVRSMVEHALHLSAHPTSGNWLAMEMNGLFHVGALFPEFSAAAAWRDMAVEKTYAELTTQVYPDGAQIELAPGYHGVSLGNFLGILGLARLNDLDLPEDFAAKLENMFEYYIKIRLPDGTMPALNDSGWGHVDGMLRRGLELFPEREDFRFFATAGKEGRLPAYTSCAMPYSGWYMMRGGWQDDDLYLHFDAGPFGYGHQHEDKLNLIVHGYGSRLLTEGGVYAYDSSQWRRYILSTRAHNTVRVDGGDQHRRGARSRWDYVSREPIPNPWITNDLFDYAEGTYDEGYGSAKDRAVRHIRKVFFVKPDYWLVIDTLTPEDAKPHAYEVLFHFDTDKAAVLDGGTIVSRSPTGANLAIVPFEPTRAAGEIVAGVEDPEVQGWVPAGGYDVRPVATAVFRGESAEPVVLPWLLLPLRPGAEPDVRVTRSGTGDHGTDYEVHLPNGIVDRFVLAEDPLPAVTWERFEGDRRIRAATVAQPADR